MDFWGTAGETGDMRKMAIKIADSKEVKSYDI